MATENDARATRDRIARDYADALRQSSSCCGEPDGKGAVAPAAGYQEDDLGDLPQALKQSSFGCGNPLAFSDVQAGETVVDLGSGAGLDLLIAARKVGPAGLVIGVDMTDAMIEQARSNAAEAGFENVEVRKGVIEALPIESVSVDWVISNCVINLSPEKEKVFAEIARVLKPGGRMLVSDIVATSLPHAVRQDARLVSCCLGGAISEEDYTAGLTRAGLVDVQVQDRIRYDAAQLAALASSRPYDEAAQPCCGEGSVTNDPVAVARQIEGKVWSAQFYGRKPA